MPTALLSVYDKAGIVELAEGLHQLGWRIVSSGGTAKAVAAAGTPVTDLADLTGVPAILDHRVVTLHPKIHGGLLADPTKPEHQADMAEYGIDPIDLVVCNLYPFATDPSIELIDIGGPAMVRAAAKNHQFVAVVVDPSDYGVVLDELRADGTISAATKRRLARDAFARIAAYDAQIAEWFNEGPLPETMHLSLRKAQPLRYGENPHQSGARYLVDGRRSWWDDAVQHGGKELSYLNLFDTEAAWRLVHRIDGPACVIVKHANPCGVAVGDDITDAYVKANACDPVSAFGGIVALNRAVPAALADALAAVFTEVIVAPSFDADALAILTEKKNLRVLTGPQPYGAALDIRSIDGGLLVQEVDTVNLDVTTWRVVTTAVADRRAVGRPAVRLAGLRGRQQQRHRLCQGLSGVRDRRRPTEPSRLGAHRRRTGRRPGSGRGVRQRCVLPVPRRSRRRRGSRHTRRHPTRRQRSRRRDDRRSRRARHRDGVHRRAPLPPLTPKRQEIGQVSGKLVGTWPGFPTSSPHAGPSRSNSSRRRTRPAG